MQHRKLDRLMTPVERIARVAAAGLTSATSSTTKPSGAKSYDNADGTRTIIGNVANGESNPSYTMATHVGDVTAPGTPTGVTASSKSGVVVVEWDGTLSGGIPDDFFAVRVYLDGAELGILTGAGSVSSASLEGGTTHAVTATAEDDCCLPDGTPAHNVSAPTAVISVTVSEGVESVAAIAQEALDVANATGQHFWSDSDGIHVTEVTQEEWQTTPSGANVLINSAGQLFRSVLNNLLAILPSGIAIYDGLGNAASNIVASFTASAVEFFTSGVSVASFCSTLARIGIESSYHVEVNNSGLKVTDGTHVPLDLSVVSDAGILDVDEVNVTDTVVARGSGQFEGGILAGTTSNSNYISHVKWGTGNAVTNGNGITTFNPGMGVKPLTVVVVMQHNAETEAIAKIAVPIIWSIDSATQVQVRWKRTDTNAWLTSNRVCWTWLAIA